MFLDGEMKVNLIMGVWQGVAMVAMVAMVAKFIARARHVLLFYALRAGHL
jgi:hypothetical protein